MDRRIFEMGLSVEATSLYLLLVPLAEAGTPLNHANALQFWNAPEDKLHDASRELMSWGIITQGADNNWLLSPANMWAPPGQDQRS